jgi:hypothetical protein
MPSLSYAIQCVTFLRVVGGCFAAKTLSHEHATTAVGGLIEVGSFFQEHQQLLNILF